MDTFISLFASDDFALNYVVTHVFFPVEIPEETDYTIQNDLSLARAVCTAAHAYTTIDEPFEAQWHSIVKMLDCLQASIQSEDFDEDNFVSQLSSMRSGDILAFHIRAQFSGIVFRKREDRTLCELFDVSPDIEALRCAKGRFECSYPGTVIEVPNHVFDDVGFQTELARLSFPHQVDSDPPSVPAASDSDYTIAPLTGILRGIGCIVENPRVLKRVRDDIGRLQNIGYTTCQPWRRSSLWLLIRVAIQTSLDRSPLGRASYKEFMLFFICNIANNAPSANLSSNLLYLMLTKILRRLSKLSSSASRWLSNIALETSSSLQDTLDIRAAEIQAVKLPLPYWAPSELDLVADTRLTLPHISEYIRSTLSTTRETSPVTHFCPKPYYRGTLDDFLSLDTTYFDKAYGADPFVALYDVEKSVQRGIDLWITHVADVDEACMQLGTLIDAYLSSALVVYEDDPEHTSVIAMTAMELWVALDKLVVAEIPMLAEYSPEIPIRLLESLILRERIALHRFTHIYQYLLARHSNSHTGFSVLSDEFTEDSFPVRYCDSSPDLQSVKGSIEMEMILRSNEDEEYEVGVASLRLSLRVYLLRFSKPEVIWDDDAPSLVPILPLHLKVITFELQCPALFRIWRSALIHLLYRFDAARIEPFDGLHKHRALLFDIPEMRPYLAEHPLEGKPAYSQFHLAYFDPFNLDSRNSPRLGYDFQRFLLRSDVVMQRETIDYRRCIDESRSSRTSNLCYCDTLSNFPPKHEGSLENIFAKYIGNTTHTPNDVISAQASCPWNLTIDEFIACGHLRSEGSIQWFNILCKLHNRTLNFRSDEVNFLLAQATSEVGPLDTSTGEWVWRRELQDPLFCNLLLSELRNLFLDISAGSLDEAPMLIISSLLTRVLAESPHETISEQAIQLLRNVRSKTFEWVLELAYNLMQAPMDEERRRRLYNMATTCRRTFDVSDSALRKVLHSAEDVEALLSCAFFIRATYHAPNFEKCHEHNCRPGHLTYKLSGISSDGILFYGRDRRLSVAVEGILMDAIQADASDRGIDLAVHNIWPGYQPGTQKWEPEQHQNTHWLVSTTAATADRHSQTVRINLLDGSLLVDGRPLGGLPSEILKHPLYMHVFEDRAPFVIPSNIPGMDFASSGTIFSHYVGVGISRVSTSRLKQRQVHFSLRGDDLVIRAQCEDTADVFELVPPEKLEEGLPKFLVMWHVHWLNLSTSVIEIRHRYKRWDKSHDNWMVTSANGKYHVYKNCKFLVDPQSRTWAMVSTLLQGLTLSDSLLISMVTTDSSRAQQLSVTLPDHNLSFFVNNEGDLESDDFKGMIYDENQCIGSLFGLMNRLVLRAKDVSEGLVPRCILVPLDPFKILSIVPYRRVKYHVYKVDTELGCLTGDSSSGSKEFLSYLHAKTSIDWRPDSLTGRTGAQEALSILQSARYESLMDYYMEFNYYYDYLKDIESLWYPQIVIAATKCNHEWTRINELHLTLSTTRSAYLFLPAMQFSPPPSDSQLEDTTYTIAHLAFDSPWQVTLYQLLSTHNAPILPSLIKLPQYRFPSPGDMHLHPATPVFHHLLSSLRMKEGDPRFQEQYIMHLHASARCVREEHEASHGLVATVGYSVEKLKNHFAACKEKSIDALRIFRESLGPTANPLQQALARCGQWPLITTYSLLGLLASTSSIQISESWKKCLVSYALLLLELQRARRLLRFAQEGLEEEFNKEVENEGCDGWSAEQYPDWLLIQLQGDFLIRRNQANIAMKMMSPQLGNNTVMQVNMGEGKSSVIIPIVAATLANGHQLARVIVPKALKTQMFHLLVDRLGGLTNRPILCRQSHSYHSSRYLLSRNSPYQEMSACLQKQSILLVHPEDVLSLRLTSVEKQLPQSKLAIKSSSKLQKLIHECAVSILSFNYVGTMWPPNNSYLTHVLQGLCGPPSNLTIQPGVDDTLECTASKSGYLELQKWLHSYARDILDESDEILHPRHQLIYAIGHPQHIEGYPGRWTIIQQVLKLVKRYAPSLASDLPDSVEYGSRQPGSFPHFRILRSSDAGRLLVSLLVGDIMSGHLPSFDFQFIGETQRDAIRSFIFLEDVQPEDVKKTELYAKSSLQGNLWNGLLLLRGLFACNVLLFTLTERRWRVDYGLDSEPWVHGGSLAFPYRAKDVPATGAQFSHPDVTILLTCLSYYYTGLTQEELRLSFHVLLNHDDPAMEYALWTSDCGSTLPPSLRNLDQFNLESSEQWDCYIYPIFAYNQAATDFYLSHIIFPKKAKEYPWKLATSSWDLAEGRGRPATGFSGTNDGQYLLPVSMTQQELSHQQGANARVLAYLLQPENNFYTVITRETSQPSQTIKLLEMVVSEQPEIRVLLDVGAQILDLSNQDLAQEWLKITNVAGVIYFNWDDELMVLTRNRNSQPLVSSPLSQQLDRCVIYLDHDHTRGTDLKFPLGFRAAVTLGPNVTKDKLVQGCMRMRKLGNGHSVMFFAPLEVDQSIRSITRKEDRNVRINTADVLKWAIHETWTDIRKWAPYWAQQGMNHQKRHNAWTRFCKSEITQEQLADAWLEPEVKSLSDLYAPHEARDTSESVSSRLETDIDHRCEFLGVSMSSIHSVQLDEQLERQVNREIERERQVELPPKAEPAEHFLHPDVVAFVKTGTLRRSKAFRPIFTSLEKSSAATSEAHVWSPYLLATADFCETIKHVPADGSVDQYLRPVQWILSGKQNNERVLVVVSPFEADRLIADIRMSKHVHLHVYVPRISKRMKPADDLKFYSIPPVPDDWVPPWNLIDQLNIFAGQLYLRDWDAYLRLSRFLNVQEKKRRTNWYNLFNDGSRKELDKTHSNSLLPFVMMLLAIRRRGLPFADTHMGKILQGQPLTEQDFV